MSGSRRLWSRVTTIVELGVTHSRERRGTLFYTRYRATLWKLGLKETVLVFNWSVSNFTLHEVDEKEHSNIMGGLVL